MTQLTQRPSTISDFLHLKVENVMCHYAAEFDVKLSQPNIWQHWMKGLIVGKTHTEMLFCRPSFQLLFSFSDSLDGRCKSEAHCVARGQGSPPALRWGFRLFSCLGEADLLAVTYLMYSLPQSSTDTLGERIRAALFPQSFTFCVLFHHLLAFITAQNRGFQSLLLSLSLLFLCVTLCG